MRDTAVPDVLPTCALKGRKLSWEWGMHKTLSGPGDLFI